MPALLSSLSDTLSLTPQGSTLLLDRYMYVHVGVLCCFALFVCLTLLASFFLPSHLSFKNMYMWNNKVMSPIVISPLAYFPFLSILEIFLVGYCY